MKIMIRERQAWHFDMACECAGSKHQVSIILVCIIFYHVLLPQHPQVSIVLLFIFLCSSHHLPKRSGACCAMIHSPRLSCYVLPFSHLCPNRVQYYL